ncbi:HAD family hydrolase [archaeon]|nr:HAD family hydrolase [archaeon]NCP79267.1 HAD family hydrolase [archaeon]NCP98274.1 HAD family hydrolase [archaeon]NCQ07034.1 HAD family hydrolase [archaeon]NCQ50830.1 HAD family hydrolase [archaeon]
MDSDPNLLFEIYKSEFKILKKENFTLTYNNYLKAVEETWRDFQNSKYKEDAFLKVLLKKINIKYTKSLSKAISENYNNIINNSKEYTLKNKFSKNTLKLIKYLIKKDYILGIISDTKTSWIKDWVKENKFNNFKYFSLSNEVGGKKASGKPYVDFINKIKLDGYLPSNVLHIGDLSVDIEAKKYGINAVLYNPLKLPYKHFLYKPDYVIEDLIDVINIINK